MSFLGGSRGISPQKFFEMNIHWDANWCILRHNFVTMLLVYCNDNNILGGKLGSWAFWGGSFYPSNTLDRTLTLLYEDKPTSKIWVYYTIVQYRSKESYHPLARCESRRALRDSRSARRDFCRARSPKNCKYCSLKFSRNFDCLL